VFATNTLFVHPTTQQPNTTKCIQTNETFYVSIQFTLQTKKEKKKVQTQTNKSYPSNRMFRPTKKRVTKHDTTYGPDHSVGGIRNKRIRLPNEDDSDEEEKDSDDNDDEEKPSQFTNRPMIHRRPNKTTTATSRIKVRNQYPSRIKATTSTAAAAAVAPPPPQSRGSFPASKFLESTYHDADDGNYQDDNDTPYNRHIPIAQEEDRQRKRSKKKSKKGFGVGYGGGGSSSTGMLTVDTEDPNHATSDDDVGTTGYYNKDSLSQLLQEQQQSYGNIQSPNTLVNNDDDDNHYHQNKDTVDTSRMAQNVSTIPMELPVPLSSLIDERDDYIPFSPPAAIDSSTGTTTAANTEILLTGDEAISYMEQHQHQLLHDRNVMVRPQQMDQDDVYLPTAASAHDINSNNSNHDNGDDDEDDWEAEVIRRAGIRATKKGSSPLLASNSVTNVRRIGTRRNDTTDHDIHTAATSTSTVDYPNQIMNQLRAQINVALDKLKDHQADTKRRFEHQQAELDTHHELLLRHEQELRTYGTAYEFYETWRNEYIIWMGALRELQSKVGLILTSLHTLERDKYATQRFIEYDNDMITILYEHNVLEHVIGRQPVLPPKDYNITNTGSVIDEFGRNVLSQSRMQREKRRRHRRRIWEQRKNHVTKASSFDDMASSIVIVDTNALSSRNQYIRGDESDGLISDGEEENFRERHDALQSALSEALNEIDEDYITLHKLIDFFTEWYDAYPDDYKMAYASHGLVDLASILIQAELCSLNNPWNNSGGYNEAKWIVAIHRAMNNGAVCDTISIERLFQKYIIPTITDLVQDGGINLISSHQTRSLCTFITHLQKLLPPSNPQWVQLVADVSAHLVQSLDNIAIPILTPTNALSLLEHHRQDETTTDGSKREEYEEAIHVATRGQLYRSKKILENIFIHWIPTIQPVPHPELRLAVLQFIANKFVVFLSSLHGPIIPMMFDQNDNNGLSETPADIFRSIYERLLPTGWLDVPEYMLYTATIRAAARAYNIQL
jgi:hypothetical protein